MTRFSITNGRYCCVAVLAALMAGAGSRAQAAFYYWTDGEPGAYRLAPRYPHSHQQAAARRRTQKTEKPEREATKPQGPLIVTISINEQKLKLYDSNGFFAESPISSGMRGHPTPMGVFSVIQKQKYHRSNIYSGAPMPYMQRITWSGVAMHAGVLPGYPASHGCIRMPMAFAVKMWNWTRMGARVVVIPGEISPAGFSHPLLPAFKIAPPPVAAAEAQTNDPVGAKADKGAPDTPATPTEAKLELRATIGHHDDAQPTTDVPPAPLRAQMHTADASGEAPASRVMSDASPASESGIPEAAAASATTAKEAPPDQAGAKSDPTSTAAKPSDKAKGDDAKGATQAAGKSADKPQAASDADKANDTKKDQTRLIEPKHDAPKHAGQIAVFISRKDSKLYVRQNFEPLFEVPVTIAPSDRPLGTHVFTAELDKADSNVLHWSVVSLPVRGATRVDDEERPARRHKSGATASDARPAPLPDGPAEALDRISIPADTVARIADALTNGGSIIVSDQGINQGETGEGTDFIVSLR
jgi:lipoprotein-anchoring transpeptidase ErfK/SrfK